MEKSRLPPELQTVLDHFTKFRDEYSTLKTNYAAQEELIKLQKMELEKLNLHLEQLASALIDYQKRFNSTLQHFEKENERLRKVIDNIKCEYENSRDNDNEFVREVQRNNVDYIHRLESDLESLRTEMASQNEKHRIEIKSIEKRQRNEILIYEEKLERINLQEKRHRDEIESYKKKLHQLDSTGSRCSVVITQLNKKCVDDSTLPELIEENKYSEYSHPALINSTGNTVNKRKKSAHAPCRWPQLDISVKNKMETAQKSVQKKKKLYSANNETIVDLKS